MIKPIKKLSDAEIQQLNSGVSSTLKKIIELEKTENIKSAGRPKKENKKIPIGLKLSPWLNEWMNRQPESKANLIEKALIEYYQIPKHLNPDNNPET